MICRITLTLAAIAVLTASAYAGTFVLPEATKDWGCPLVDARGRGGDDIQEPTVKPAPVAPVPDEIRDLGVSGIIGEGEDLEAVVSGHKVRAGTEFKVKNFTLRAEKVTKNNVSLKITKTPDKHKSLVGQTRVVEFKK